MTGNKIPVTCPDCGKVLQFDESQDYRTCLCGVEVRREEEGGSTVTLAARTKPEVKALLEREAKARGTSLSEHVRGILADHVVGLRPEKAVNARKPSEHRPRHTEGCPIVGMLQFGYHCPHLERSLSRIGAEPGSTALASATRDHLLDTLFPDDRSAAGVVPAPTTPPPNPGPELDSKPRIDRVSER